MEHPVDVLRRYLQALEQFAAPAVLREFFTPDAVQQEMPNRLFPEGRQSVLSTMMDASEKGRKVLSTQRYVLRRAIADGDEVATEIEWTGVLREGFGRVPAGSSLRASLAIFFTFDGGKIASVRNYDCYYPFEETAGAPTP